MYSQTVLDHFGNPRNVGRPPGTNRTGAGGSPDAGPFARVYLEVDGDSIRAAGFETYGCAAAIAACSLLTQCVIGKSVQEAGSLTPRRLIELLGGLPLGKEHCAAVAITALKSALEHPGP